MSDKPLNLDFFMEFIKNNSKGLCEYLGVSKADLSSMIEEYHLECQNNGSYYLGKIYKVSKDDVISEQLLKNAKEAIEKAGDLTSVWDFHLYYAAKTRFEMFKDIFSYILSIIDYEERKKKASLDRAKRNPGMSLLGGRLR